MDVSKKEPQVFTPTLPGSIDGRRSSKLWSRVRNVPLNPDTALYNLPGGSGTAEHQQKKSPGHVPRFRRDERNSVAHFRKESAPASIASKSPRMLQFRNIASSRTFVDKQISNKNVNWKGEYRKPKLLGAKERRIEVTAALIPFWLRNLREAKKKGFVSEAKDPKMGTKKTRLRQIIPTRSSEVAPGDVKGKASQDENGLRPIQLKSSCDAIKKRSNIRDMRPARINNTVLFGKDAALCSPLSVVISLGDISDELPQLRTEERQGTFSSGSRSKNALEEIKVPAVLDHAAALKLKSCDSGILQQSEGKGDFEAIGNGIGEVRSLQTERRAFSVQAGYLQCQTQHLDLNSPRPIPGTRKDASRRTFFRGLQKLPYNDNKLQRRTSSLPGNGKQPDPIAHLQSKEDEFLSPWGINTSDKPWETPQRKSSNYVHSKFRLSNISQAVHILKGKRDQRSTSDLICLSDGDEESADEAAEQESPVEMFQDDFVEYVVKKAKKKKLRG